jgi:hypothetical protein
MKIKNYLLITILLSILVNITFAQSGKPQYIIRTE